MVNTSWFETPTSAEVGGLYEFFIYVSRVTAGLFFPFILLSLWMIIFITQLASGNYERPSAGKSFVVSSFIIMILSIPLAILEFMAPKYMYASMIMVGIGIVWLVLENSRE